MGFLFARWRLASLLLRNGRLLWRLIRDSRTPLLPKLILGAALLYALSPLDFVPDFVPLVGQLDDVAVLALGLELFFKNVPEWLRREHEVAIGRTSQGTTVIQQ